MAQPDSLDSLEAKINAAIASASSRTSTRTPKTLRVTSGRNSSLKVQQHLSGTASPGTTSSSTITSTAASATSTSRASNSNSFKQNLLEIDGGDDGLSGTSEGIGRENTTTSSGSRGDDDAAFSTAQTPLESEAAALEKQAEQRVVTSSTTAVAPFGVMTATHKVASAAVKRVAARDEIRDEEMVPSSMPIHSSSGSRSEVSNELVASSIMSIPSIPLGSSGTNMKKQQQQSLVSEMQWNDGILIDNSPSSSSPAKSKSIGVPVKSTPKQLSFKQDDLLFGSASSPTKGAIMPPSPSSLSAFRVMPDDDETLISSHVGVASSSSQTPVATTPPALRSATTSPSHGLIYIDAAAEVAAAVAASVSLPSTGVSTTTAEVQIEQQSEDETTQQQRQQNDQENEEEFINPPDIPLSQIAPPLSSSSLSKASRIYRVIGTSIPSAADAQATHELHPSNYPSSSLSPSFMFRGGGVHTIPSHEKEFVLPSPSRNVSPRLLEPTHSWNKLLETKKQENDAALAKSRAKHEEILKYNMIQKPAGSSSRSSTSSRSRSISGRAQSQPPRLRSSSRSTASVSSSIATTPARNNTSFSYVKSRLHEPTFSMGRGPNGYMAPPLLPPSTYTPGLGHSREWVSLTDSSSIARLPEQYNTNNYYKQYSNNNSSSSNRRTNNSSGGDGGGDGYGDSGRATSVPVRRPSSSASSCVSTTPSVSGVQPMSSVNAVRRTSVSSASTRRSSVSSLHAREQDQQQQQQRQQQQQFRAAPPQPPTQTGKAYLNGNSTLLHPIRRSQLRVDAENEREMQRAKALGLFIGARERRQSFNEDESSVNGEETTTTMIVDVPSSTSTTGEATVTISTRKKKSSASPAAKISPVARAAQRLYDNAGETRQRLASKAIELPPEFTFAPAVTNMARIMQDKVPYLPKEIYETMRPIAAMTTAVGGYDNVSTTSSNANTGARKRSASVSSTSSSANRIVATSSSNKHVPRHEALYAAAAVSAAKKAIAAATSLFSHPEMRFIPTINQSSQHMGSREKRHKIFVARSTSADPRLRNIAGASSTASSSAIHHRNEAIVRAQEQTLDFSDRLYAYSQVFEDRRNAAASAYYASIAPLKPSLNVKSLHMAAHPTTPSGLTRRPIYEPSPDTTAESLAKRKRKIELEQCTFAPETLTTSASHARRHPNKSNNEAEETEEPVHERLLRFGAGTATKLEHERAAYAAKEMVGVTFTPAINDTIGFETLSKTSPRPNNKVPQSGVRSVSASRSSVGSGGGEGGGNRRPSTSSTSSNGIQTNVEALLPPTMNASQRLYEEAKRSEQRLAAKRKELEKMRRETFTFTPHLSDTTRALADKNMAARINQYQDNMRSSSSGNNIINNSNNTSSLKDAEALTLPRALRDCAWDTVREFEHTRSRLIQALIRAELAKGVNIPPTSSSTATSIGGKGEGGIKKRVATPPIVNEIALRAIHILDLETPSSTSSFSSSSLGGSNNRSASRSARNGHKSLTAKLSKTGGELSFALWRSLYQNSTKDSEMKAMKKEIHLRLQLRDASFCPRPLEHHLPLMASVTASVVLAASADGSAGEDADVAAATLRTNPSTSKSHIHVSRDAHYDNGDGEGEEEIGATINDQNTKMRNDIIPRWNYGDDDDDDEGDEETVRIKVQFSPTQVPQQNHSNQSQTPTTEAHESRESTSDRSPPKEEEEVNTENATV